VSIDNREIQADILLGNKVWHLGKTY